jgi:hypothetical protein
MRIAIIFLALRAGLGYIQEMSNPLNFHIIPGLLGAAAGFFCMKFFEFFYKERTGAAEYLSSIVEHLTIRS